MNQNSTESTTEAPGVSCVDQADILWLLEEIIMQGTLNVKFMVKCAKCRQSRAREVLPMGKNLYLRDSACPVCRYECRDFMSFSDAELFGWLSRPIKKVSY